MTFSPANLLANTMDGSFWMPPSASTVAPDVDWLFMFIFWITAFFFVLIAVLMVIFCIKYRWRPGRDNADPVPAHSTALEITWTVIPTVIVLFIFYWGFKGFLDMAVPPPNAVEINVLANQWSWLFVYPDGFSTDKPHLPINKPVQFVMSSSDVIHSLYFPEFRTKRDVVPGRFNRFWVTPTETGKFDIYCAEYCGTGHSQMLSECTVEDEASFHKWEEDAKDWSKTMSPVAAGKMLIDRNGCLQCHNVDGVQKNAPSFLNLFGDQVPLASGAHVLADDNYIMESIYEPAAKVVQGYPVLMSSYRGRLKDADIMAIVEYMKSISKNYHGPAPDTSVHPRNGAANPTSQAATQVSGDRWPATMPQSRQ